MSGLFQLLSIGARNLATVQFAQATVGNNAANAATPGFSRRRTNLIEADPVVVSQGTLGTGVDVGGLERLRDTLLDAQLRLDTQDFQFAKAQKGILDQVGALLSPPDDNALASSINGLFAAFGDLASRPEDPAVRRQLVAQAQTTADAFHQARDAVDTITRDTFHQIQDRVAEINQTSQSLASINSAFKLRPADPALLDQRDQLIDRLSELIGVRVTATDEGPASVVVNGTGIQLVDGLRAATVAVSGDPAVGSATLTVDGFTLAAPGGEVGGLLDMRNSSTDGLPAITHALDALAGDLITAVNRVHAGGSGLVPTSSFTGSVSVANSAAPLNAAGLAVTPTSGTLTLGVTNGSGALVSSGSVSIDPTAMSLDDLASAIDALPDVAASVVNGALRISTENAANRLVVGADTSDSLAALGVNGFFTGSDAHTIGVDAQIDADPRRIAAAQADLVTGLVSPGDGRNAQALAALRTADAFGGNTQTAAEFLGALGGAVGTAARAAGAQVDTLDGVIQAVQTQQQSVSGVNVDEELADMIRYQHAYEASAKFVSTIDQMLETLLGMVG